MGPLLDVLVTRDGGTATIVLAGELDTYTVPQLRSVIDELIAGACNDVTLDIGGVDFIDSTGLSTFVAVRKLLAARNGTLRLIRCTERVARLLEMCGLRERFVVDETSVA